MRMNIIEANPFDRQERISWWKQDKLKQARVMVVGAGAIGNEVLKNLALLGFGNIFIVDFDTISTSNLSRTVLFKRGDEGKRKAELAAERIQQMSLFHDAKIDWFHGDAVWELGTGIYKEMDIVLGCLDNVETRLAVNRQCWLAQTPWIDSGIFELAGHISVFCPPCLPCYECHIPEEHLHSSRKRYSCDIFKKASFIEGRIPTVQVTSAIVAAIQVQETIKLLHGNHNMAGKKLVYQGTNNACDVYTMPVDDNCTSYHPCITDVVKTDLTKQAKVVDLLNYVSGDAYSGDEPILDISAEQWAFVSHIFCNCCNSKIRKNKPSFLIYDSELTCNKCRNENKVPSNINSNKLIITEFNHSTSQALLNLTLEQIGFPSMHFVAIRNKLGNITYYEICGDREIILPNISSSTNHHEED